MTIEELEKRILELENYIAIKNNCYEEIEVYDDPDSAEELADIDAEINNAKREKSLALELLQMKKEREAEKENIVEVLDRVHEMSYIMPNPNHSRECNCEWCNKKGVLGKGEYSKHIGEIIQIRHSEDCIVPKIEAILEKFKPTETKGAGVSE